MTDVSPKGGTFLFGVINGKRVLTGAPLITLVELVSIKLAREPWNTYPRSVHLNTIEHWSGDGLN